MAGRAGAEPEPAADLRFRSRQLPSEVATTDARTSAPPLESYGAIGDGRSVALVSAAGGIDWLCWPRFDSDALFASLLDRRRGGTFRISPVAPCTGTQAYVPDTNVLVTRFDTGAARARLVDFMPADTEEAKRRRLVPQHELIRLVTCEAGELELDVRFEPRPDFGRSTARLVEVAGQGVRVELDRRLFLLRSDLRLRLEDGAAVGHVRLRAGETRRFSLSFSSEAPAVLPPLSMAGDLLERTIAWWRTWIGRARYDGPHAALVRRSLLALKLLSFAPSGAIVAAPTTSLPERPGGDLNWDYRYCWLRDAAYTVQAYLDLGYEDEASAFVSWLLHSTRLTRPELRVAYDVHGREPGPERELPHLDGYAGSRPVRVGNAAVSQLQLDTYGAVIDATTELVRAGAGLDRETAGMISDFGEWVCRHWERPDSGLWEPRSAPRHHTHSKVLCWVALDRLLELHRRGLTLRRFPAERFRHNRALLRDAVERRGWSPTLGSYVASFEGTTVDASLLRVAWYGFTPPDAPRMRATWALVRARLSPRPGLLFRYEESRIVNEGAFGICGFWAAEHLARGGGRLDEARAWFEAAVGFAGPLGLFAEEIDPVTGAALGNYPQAFTHLGLIGAALALEHREAGDARATPAAPPREEVHP